MRMSVDNKDIIQMYLGDNLLISQMLLLWNNKQWLLIVNEYAIDYSCLIWAQHSFTFCSGNIQILHRPQGDICFITLQISWMHAGSQWSLNLVNLLCYVHIRQHLYTIHIVAIAYMFILVYGFSYMLVNKLMIIKVLLKSLKFLLVMDEVYLVVLQILPSIVIQDHVCFQVLQHIAVVTKFSSTMLEATCLLLYCKHPHISCFYVSDHGSFHHISCIHVRRII